MVPVFHRPMADDDEEMPSSISGPELASILERLALTRNDGDTKAVSGTECERVLGLLGIQHDHQSRRSVTKKREDLVQVGEQYPGLLQAAFAVDQWVGGAQHPAAALLTVHNFGLEEGEDVGVFPDAADTEARDLVLSDGTWARAPDPEPVVPVEHEVPDKDDGEEVSTGELLKQIQALQQSQKEQSASFDERVRETATQLLRDANQGKAEVEIIPAPLSAAERLKSNAWPLSIETRVADWRRGPDRDFNLIAVPEDTPTEGDDDARMLALRNVLLECSMQKDDRARLLRTCPAPSGYTTPFSLSPEDKAALGAKRQGIQETWAKKQESLLEQIIPLMHAMSAAGDMQTTLMAPATEFMGDDNRTAAVQLSLERIEQCLSDAVHLVAYPLTELQRKRYDMLTEAYSGVDGLKLVHQEQAGRWYATRTEVDDASKHVGTRILETAQRARQTRKDLNALKSKNWSARPQPRAA